MKRSPVRRRLPADADAVAAFRAAVLARARGRCQLGVVLIGAGPDEPAAVTAGRRCAGTANSAHHVEARGMGGHGNNDPANGLACCNRCHVWVESNRAVAYRLGLLKRHS